MNKPYITVEYDMTYFGGDYNDVGTIVKVPETILEWANSHCPDNIRSNERYNWCVRHAFAMMTEIDPIHIIHYSNEVFEADEE